MGFFYKEEEWVEDNPVEKEDEYVEIFGKSKGHPIKTFSNCIKVHTGDFF